MTPPRQSSGSPVGGLSAGPPPLRGELAHVLPQATLDDKKGAFLVLRESRRQYACLCTRRDPAAHFELHDGAVVVLRNQQIASLVGEDPSALLPLTSHTFVHFCPAAITPGIQVTVFFGRRRRERRRCGGRCGTTSLRRASSRPARSAAARRRRRLARGDRAPGPRILRCLRTCAGRQRDARCLRERQHSDTHNRN